MKLYEIAEPGQSIDEQYITNQKNEIVVGIDLGTTNSLVALSRNGEVEIFADESGNKMLPSLVRYLDADAGEEILVGDEARAESSGCMIASVKRLMSKGGDDSYFQQHKLSFEVDSAQDGLVRIKVGDKRLTPVEVSAQILRSLKVRAEKSLGAEVKKAVITVPAYFDEAAREATRAAAKIAGLEVLRLLNEPTAAAVAYSLDRAEQGTYAIYDLGGGTFDVSILKMSKGVLQVLATGGDAVLGGDDFDSMLREHIEIKYNLESLADLNLVARALKEQLSSSAKASVYYKGKSIEVTLEEFEDLIAPLVERTIAIFKSVVRDAELTMGDLNEIILVGGSSRVPLISQKLLAISGKSPLNEVNPDEIVVRGAAIQAEALAQGSSQLLLDVVALSLGLELADGTVEHIIHRNTPIPVFRTQKYTTQQDGQGGIIIHVVQGESQKITECRSVAKFELRGIPPMLKGDPRVEVTFQLDADGILSVKAKELTSGVSQEVVAKPAYGLTEDEMKQLILAGNC